MYKLTHNLASWERPFNKACDFVGQFTIFAPTDAAMDKLDSNLKIRLLRNGYSSNIKSALMGQSQEMTIFENPYCT
jgi:hypothetical protein